MLRSRVIPCLLVKNLGLVKTIQFKQEKYVGDPINAVKIFNEKKADELIVLDISATSSGSKPDYKMIKSLAAECRMPLCYGGGVTTVEEFKKIVSFGVEKVAISSSAINNPSLISSAAKVVGSQSVVVIIDVKKSHFNHSYEVYINNGKESTNYQLSELVNKFESLGAGEIVINSIDQDGIMKGYDLDLVEMVKKIATVPLTILGGAGSHEHIRQIVSRYGVIGAAAGSLFVFKGKYRAVLINYPNEEEKDKIVTN